MAVVVPALRLWLLLLNLYGTFKAIKPPPVSLRNTRNGQGPSGRAMQLRKREMKSRLVVWVVWAIFSALERPLDRSLGILTPFYNEIKCTVLIFLIVTRSHGAEAIFMYLIHPLMRPYVPQVDSALATLQSVFELVILIVCLPWEYALHWWHQWGWSQIRGLNIYPPSSGESSPDGSDAEDHALDQRRLRSQSVSRLVSMRQADRQAQVIFQDIENAQDRVRTRASNQFAARNNARTQPVRETRNTGPNPVRLRTRKQVLDHANGRPEEATRVPGSRSTGIHYLNSTSISQLGQGATPQQPSALPNAPASQPVASSPPQLHIPTPSSSNQSSQEIWYPPSSAYAARKGKPPSPDGPRRTPSPIYPPLPSAYRFTPRRSDPLPPHPRILTPPDATPRRVSTGAMFRGAVDAYDGIDQFPGRSSQADPLGSARLEDPLSHSRGFHEHSRIEPDDFFHQALESSIQTMDMDMQPLPTRDGSSASEVSMQEGGIRPELGDMAEAAEDTKETHGNKHESPSESTRTRKAVVPTGTVRHSARTRGDGERSLSVETDEFGFTIRSNTSALKRLTVDPSSGPSQGVGAGPSRKKPLARTKPALRTTEGVAQSEGGDEESAKKRRKVKPSSGPSRSFVESMHHREAASLDGHTRATAGKMKRKVTVNETNQRTNSVEDVSKDWPVRTRATRASTRQLLSGQGRTNVIKRDREN